MADRKVSVYTGRKASDSKQAQETGELNRMRNSLRIIKKNPLTSFFILLGRWQSWYVIATQCALNKVLLSCQTNVLLNAHTKKNTFSTFIF